MPAVGTMAVHEALQAHRESVRRHKVFMPDALSSKQATTTPTTTPTTTTTTTTTTAPNELRSLFKHPQQQHQHQHQQ
jgi:hypothetical protein